jgi:hypothetical protein
MFWYFLSESVYALAGIIPGRVGRATRRLAYALRIYRKQRGINPWKSEQSQK